MLSMKEPTSMFFLQWVCQISDHLQSWFSFSPSRDIGFMFLPLLQQRWSYKPKPTSGPTKMILICMVQGISRWKCLSLVHILGPLHAWFSLESDHDALFFVFLKSNGNNSTWRVSWRWLQNLHKRWNFGNLRLDWFSIWDFVLFHQWKSLCLCYMLLVFWKIFCEGLRFFCMNTVHSSTCVMWYFLN